MTNYQIWPYRLIAADSVLIWNIVAIQLLKATYWSYVEV